MFDIVHVNRANRRVSLTVHRTSVSSAFRPVLVPSYFLVLAHPGRFESASGTPLDAPGTFTFALANLHLPGMFTSGGGGGLQAGWSYHELPSPSESRPIDESWIDGAEIAIIEMRYAGRLVRRLHVDQLQAREQAQAVGERVDGGGQ